MKSVEVGDDAHDRESDGVAVRSGSDQAAGSDAEARWVPRPRLVATLDGGLEAKLTLVCAPTGWGKTSAVAEWAASPPSDDIAWLSLDRDDDEPLRFWRCVVAALSAAARPTVDYASWCGQLPVGWYFCEPADPQAKGAVERWQGYMETNFEPGRRFANHLDFQLQLDAWFARANARTHKTLRERPIDRLLEEREVMRALPAREPDLDRRWVTRVPPDPHVRFDTNDYSLDPSLVGRRVEVRVSQREVIAVGLDTGELACRHERCFAKHETITALEHARTLRERRGQPGVDELVVEQRPLSVYDQLIA